jgi:hypothetical protein
MAAQAIQRAEAQYFQQAERLVEGAAGPSPPSVSRTIEALHPAMIAGCRNVLDEMGPISSSEYERADNAISKSLAGLREEIGLSDYAKQAREALESLSSWAHAVPLPGSGSGARKIKVVAAGGGTTATIGFAIGGPLGWFLGAAIGLGVSAVVDHFTNNVDSRDKLRERLQKHANEAFASFAETVDQAIRSAGGRLDRRIRGQVQPLLSEMARRLEEIREPTPDELRLHAEMHATTVAALALLAPLLGAKMPGG